MSNVLFDKLIRHYRPCPSDETTLDNKLEALSNLISLNNSLFKMIELNHQEISEKEEVRLNAARATHFDLMIIAQLLNDNLEREFDQFRKFLLEQGGKDAN